MKIEGCESESKRRRRRSQRCGCLKGRRWRRWRQRNAATNRQSSIGEYQSKRSDQMKSPPTEVKSRCVGSYRSSYYPHWPTNATFSPKTSVDRLEPSGCCFSDCVEDEGSIDCYVVTISVTGGFLVFKRLYVLQKLVIMTATIFGISSSVNFFFV